MDINEIEPENLPAALAFLRSKKATITAELWIVLIVFQAVLILSLILFGLMPESKERTYLIISKVVFDLMSFGTYVDLRLQKRRVIDKINEIVAFMEESKP